MWQFSDFVSMMRTPRYKFVHFLGETFGQLFDLADDPNEDHDRWDDASLRPVREEFRDAWMQWRLQSAYRAREWSEAMR